MKSEEEIKGRHSSVEKKLLVEMPMVTVHGASDSGRP
jgi:hypothetical protein